MSSSLSPSESVKGGPEHQALRDYLSGGVSSLSSAQDDFCEPLEDKYMKTENPSDVEELLWRAWKAVTGVAAQTPHESDKRQKLVDFIVNLESRPKLEKNGNTCQVWEATVWSELPVLGAQVRESWNFAPLDDSPEEAKQHWLNLNAVVATLVATQYNSGKPDLDLSLFGIWTIRSGLEDQETPSSIAVEAAAVWFVYAAPALFGLSKQPKEFDGKIARPGRLAQDKQWSGYSVERWRNWASRFAEIHDQGLSKRGEDLVTQASKNMGDVLER